MSKIHRELKERFWSNVNKTDGCWVWHGYVYDGYGLMGRGGTTQKAHRVSYELHNGPVPDGLTVDHLCENSICVRPDHLEAVTSVENAKRYHANNKRLGVGRRLNGNRRLSNLGKNKRAAAIARDLLHIFWKLDNAEIGIVN